MEIEVDIRKKLGAFQLDVSFENEKGIIAILGASGCGKSMTLKCIAGIETPDEGRIVLNGRVLFDSAKRINLAPQKRRVGYMFQDFALFPNMTVRQNIGIVCGKRPVSEDYYARFHLEGLEDHYPAQLSGGQKQRAAMARMLAADPEMLILDEPFSALDAHLRWELERGVKKLLTGLNKPALFVSHDRDEVYRLSDMVGAMSDGKMHGITPVREFFHHPHNRTAAILSGCKNVAKAVSRDEYRLFVPAWNLTLRTSRPVLFEEGYAGIRAHYFEPVFEADSGMVDGENCIKVTETDPTEDPFEWNIAVLAEGASEWIQWKVSKDIWQYGKDPLPSALRIAPENILVLPE